MKHIAAYYEHACAVTPTGAVYCWGTPSRTSPASARNG
ncbi:RCC1 domain-containing protein [Sorangium sp. So ce327]